jgi:hypothetical protein
MFEDYSHDPGAEQAEKELNTRPLEERFGTNPNWVAKQRELREKGKKEKEK